MGVAAAGVLLACALAGPAPSRAGLAAPVGDLPRAEQLYENQCSACHESTLHVSQDHRARSRADVIAWVRHWANYERLGWSEEEVSDVSDFLIRRYYRFGSPAEP